MWRAIFVAASTMGMLLASPVWSQDDGAAPDTHASEKTPADLAFEPLGRDMKNLFDSLRNRGGVAPEDHPIIIEVRDRAAEFSRQFPDDLRGPAAELTLSKWLKDQPRIEQLYAELIRRAPDKAGIRQDWAQLLKSQNDYAGAIEVLQKAALDPATNPEAMLLLSECLFAENRFPEALEVINSVPDSALEGNLSIKPQFDQVRPTRAEYIDLWNSEQILRAQEESIDNLPRVRITTAKGDIVLELFEDIAPNTVANFINLVEQGFYNGTKFHRVIPNFMAQGGDPNSKEGAAGVPGQGNPGYYIPDETGREDHRKHFAGSLAMAKQEAPNTGGCQFFITHVPTPWLNGKHTVFGRVLEGLDVARAIKQDDVIDSITVLRKRDHTYVPTTLPLPGAAPTPMPTTAPAVRNAPAIPATIPAEPDRDDLEE